MLIPRAKCGLLVGKGGETIKDLMRRSGALIKVSNFLIYFSTFNSLGTRDTKGKRKRGSQKKRKV